MDGKNDFIKQTKPKLLENASHISCGNSICTNCRAAALWLQPVCMHLSLNFFFFYFAPTHLHRSDRLNGRETIKITQPLAELEIESRTAKTQKDYDLKPSCQGLVSKMSKRKTGRPYPFYERTPRAGSRHKRTIAHVTIVPHG